MQRPVLVPFHACRRHLMGIVVLCIIAVHRAIETNMLQAGALGNKAKVPLGVPRAELELSTLLFEGQQGSVSRGTFRGSPVAVKRVRISTGQACHHPSHPSCLE